MEVAMNELSIPKQPDDPTAVAYVFAHSLAWYLMPIVKALLLS